MWISTIFSTTSVAYVCSKVLDKACFWRVRNLDRFLSSALSAASAHSFLWISQLFSTGRSACSGFRDLQVVRRCVVALQAWTACEVGVRVGIGRSPEMWDRIFAGRFWSRQLACRMRTTKPGEGRHGKKKKFQRRFIGLQPRYVYKIVVIVNGTPFLWTRWLTRLESSA